jgi:hypothetical protein
MRIRSIVNDVLAQSDGLDAYWFPAGSGLLLNRLGILLTVEGSITQRYIMKYNIVQGNRVPGSFSLSPHSLQAFYRFGSPPALPPDPHSPPARR